MAENTALKPSFVYEAPLISTESALVIDNLLASTDGNKEVNHSLGSVFNDAEVVEIKKPKKWTSLDAKKTWCRVAYNTEFFYFAFDVEAETHKAPVPVGSKNQWGEENNVPEICQSVIYDDRCEVFLWPVVRNDTGELILAEQTYYAFEVNRNGQGLLSKTQFHRKFDFHWKGQYHGTMATFTDATSEFETFVLRIKRSDVGMGHSSDVMQELRIGLHRGMSTRKPEDLEGDMAWSSWVEPHDAVVDFHRPEMFGSFLLGS